ncbi:MAG: RagB/SusD family nutrient uptake outer membrane protein [Chitinophagaceae bacterium]|nr:RagB/SusD family nutrient uptake outer membrane protein [Chitinophagaceae bacterium]
MKYNKSFSILFTFLILLATQACKKGILDQTPQDQYSDATVWTDINLAESYLLNTYKGTGIGFAALMPTAISDEVRFTHQGAETYMQGQLSASSLGPFSAPADPNAPTAFGSWKQHFDNIQKINKFIANIDRVSEAVAESEKAGIRARTDVMKGEALFLRAYSYGQLLRLFGGVPLFSEPTELGSNYLSVGRNTFEETVNFVIADCDAATALLLDNASTVMGRAGKGVAMALKSRILLFAASDLAADGTAKSKYVGYENPDRQALWTAAKNAAKAVIDLNTYQLADFGAPDKSAVAKNFFEFFKATDLSSPEVIWGKMYSTEANFGHSNNQYNDANGWTGYSGNSATQNLVDAFQMEDGSDFFDHFTLNGNKEYVNTSGTFTSPNPYYNREPRFYATILFDSAVWKPRDPSLQSVDPLGVYDRRTRIVINGGVEISKRFGIDTRQADRSPDNGGYTGYLMKKTLDDGVITGVVDNQNAWIEMRYAEILLNYAEACIGLHEDGEAATYINMIRNRAALPDLTGEITEALRHERQVELAFESSRWYDIRRWKILTDVLTDAYGIDIVETVTDGVKSTTWRRIVAEPRTVSEKMLWTPISADEINRAPQLEQNPDY